MFERFTEPARRTIFFARYEASQFGTGEIEPEHLLLGILREDRELRGSLDPGAPEVIRKRIMAHYPEQSIATSVDMPLSLASKRILEIVDQRHEHTDRKIGCGDLLEALLQLETTFAAQLAREFKIQQPPNEPVSPEEPELEADLSRLRTLIDNSTDFLFEVLIEDRGHTLKRRNLTRREALGHLIDWAAAHKQWFALALTQSKLVAQSYPEEDWVAIQQYRDMGWPELIETWAVLNGLILKIISKIPASKVDVPCRIGIDPAVPLLQLIRKYIEYCEGWIGEILTRD